MDVWWGKSCQFKIVTLPYFPETLESSRYCSFAGLLGTVKCRRVPEKQF